MRDIGVTGVQTCALPILILLSVFMCHSSRSIAYPDAYAVRRVLDQLHGSLGGKDFRAAGWAVIHPVGEAPHLEIGRASCRERVEISVVAASLKKNTDMFI